MAVHRGAFVLKWQIKLKTEVEAKPEEELRMILQATEVPFPPTAFQKALDEVVAGVSVEQMMADVRL